MNASANLKIIPGYRHHPGFHCASSAIRNVLAFHGIQVSEPMVIGLGRAPGFSYEIIQNTPSRLIHVRHPFLEENFFRTVGLKFQWQESENAAEATRQAKELVDRGLPVLVQTDIRYLPYFNSTQHFPGHAVVICGYDDHEGTFYVSDTLYPEMLAVSYGDMEMARSSNFPPFQLRNKFFALHNLSGYRIDEAVILASIRQWAEENLLGIPGGPYTYGIAALERLIEDVHRWIEASDWSWSARFTYQIIERRGTGGAAFRTLYRQFLEKEEERYPALKKLALSVPVSVVERLYHEVAMVFRDISEREKPVFTPAQPILLNLLDGERTLYREILHRL